MSKFTTAQVRLALSHLSGEHRWPTPGSDIQKMDVTKRHMAAEAIDELLLPSNIASIDRLTEMLSEVWSS